MMDKISSLPAEVIDLILQKLPLKDRVITSTLSRFWRFRWTRLPSLPLDFKFYQQFREEGFSRCQYATIATILVLQQQSSCVQEFSFYMPVYPAASALFYHSIQSVAKSKDIKKLYLESEREGLYTVPSSILNSQNLRHLKISHTEFCLPPWFEGLPNLITFELHSELSTAQTVSRFVSLCPKLEKIILEGVRFDHENLDLKAPKLRHLHVRGNFCCVSAPNGHNLESVFIYLAGFYHEPSRTSADRFKFLTSSDLLQHVSLNGRVCERLGSSCVINRLPKYNRMKSLEFYAMELHDVDMLQCFLTFMVYSPNLRKLKLQAFPMSLAESGLATYDLLVEKLDDPELVSMVETYIGTYPEDDYEQLVRVEFVNLVGTKIEMKIIELVLRFSPALEMLAVSFADKMNKDMKQQLRKNIIDYHRASTKVNFQF